MEETPVIADPRPNTRRRGFDRALLRGRCRRNLGIGLLGLFLAAQYGLWSAWQFSRRGADANAFDRPLVVAAASMVPPPVHLRAIRPVNSRELYLMAVVTDQQDVMFGLAVLALRAVVTLTIGGLSMVLLTAGATEWEIRTKLQRPQLATADPV